MLSCRSVVTLFGSFDDQICCKFEDSCASTSLLYALVAEELAFLHLFIYICNKYFLCCSMAILESNGIAIDIKRVKVLSSELYTRKQSLQSEAWKIVGRKFNLMSVSELRKVRFDIFCANVQGMIVVFI